MAQLTAVEWFIKETTKRFNVIPKDTTKGFFANIEDYKNMVEKAKQMEKEQIIEAFLVNYSQIVWETSNPENEAEEYYNEEYGNKKML